ncbi:DEKNAAC102171 [Brettanomyces naardenensis]|uniref:DEKNAAC102171 n=1 Tax=Brettanomyces naardenensis TaxID=13370 RepID=A0A448YK07_BRENA|nr:DEKNAAC102171 [Brettanomyces naardenensis]
MESDTEKKGVGTEGEEGVERVDKVEEVDVAEKADSVVEKADSAEKLAGETQVEETSAEKTSVEKTSAETPIEGTSETPVRPPPIEASSGQVNPISKAGDVNIYTKEDPETKPEDITMTSGPYKFMPLIEKIPVENISDFPESRGAIITCVEAWDLNVYVGTSAGEIIHMYRIDDELGYIQISRQRFSNSSKIRPIRKIIILPEIGKLLVLCGKTVSGYILPELTPADIGKIRDVADMTVDYDLVQLDSKGKNYTTALNHIHGDVYVNVTVFTSKSIRLVRIFDDSIRLFKDVHYLNSVTGVQRSSYAAVATLQNYDLVDVSRSQKIPLFPSSASPPDQESGPSFLPVVLPVGKKEFLMVCGGRSMEQPAVGMVVNPKGDVSRGTIPWESYPVSLTVDFPYMIAIFAGGKVSVHSLHSQREVQRMSFPSNSDIRVKSVCRVFEMKDQQLAKALTRRPIISQMTPEELEKIAIESDLAQTNLSRSSCLIYDVHGSFVKVFQPYPRPLRWIDQYTSATLQNFQKVSDEWFDELEEETSGKDSTQGQFIVSLLILLSLKFYNFNQAFDIVCTNMKYIDPRLIIYIVDGSDSKQIYGSVWQFEGLFDFIEQLRTDYTSKAAETREFMQLYMNVCTASPEAFDESDRESIMKTIEVYLLKVGLDANEDLDPVLANLKYGSREAIEILLLRKKYYSLSRFYSSLKSYEQCLYYWKGLIVGEFTDPEYDKKFPDRDRSLIMMVNYLLTNCADKESVVKSYASWLLESYPEHGFKIVTDKRAEKVEFNDVKVLHLLENGGPDLKVKYLEYMLNVKKKKQFTGDVILSILDELLELLKSDEALVSQVDSSLTKYSSLRVPRISFFDFWKLEKTKFATFADLHDRLYFYLSGIAAGTMSILDQCPVLDRCEKEILETKYGKMTPLISLMIYFRKGDNKTVVNELCDLGDYRMAEQFATTLNLPDIGKQIIRQQREPGPVDEDDKKTSEALLMVIFDVYLELKNPELIDSFLSHHHLLKDDTTANSSMIERMDKFSDILNRIPDSFPVCQLQNFLERSLSDFQDYGDTIVLTKNLYRSKDLQLKKFRGSLRDS